MLTSKQENGEGVAESVELELIPEASDEDGPITSPNLEAWIMVWLVKVYLFPVLSISFDTFKWEKTSNKFQGRIANDSFSPYSLWTST